jgi:phosphoribosylamine--glycine ligase
VACLEPDGLERTELEWSDDWAVTVVIASAGYPSAARKGDRIRGLDEIPGADPRSGRVGEVEVTHAGTARDAEGRLVSAGGRVLNLTGLGPTPETARSNAYAAVERITFEGAQHRTDIGARAVARVAG